jgi:Ca-activated chloride channel homolog
MYINFVHQYYLVFLFVIPVLIFFHFFGLKNIRGKSLKFANFEAIARIKGIDLYSKNIMVLLFNILIIALIIFSLSGMTLYKELPASSFSFVIAIDNSDSMSAKDFVPDRLSAAKETAATFVDSLPADSYVGIISFSGDTTLTGEITKNKLDLKSSINDIQLSSVGGTDIIDAITNSINMLKNEERKSVILISDGQINVGTIGDAIKAASENKVVVHTLGIGTLEGGETSFGLSKLDEDSLKSLAYNTGGKYFKIENNQELKSSFDQIIEVTQRTGKIDLTAYLLILVVFLFLIKEFLLSINKIIW